MEKLVKKQKLMLILAISAIALAAVSVAGIVLFTLKLLYLPLVLCFLVLAHGFYGAPLYLMRRNDYKRCEIVLAFISEGIEDKGELSLRTGFSVEYTDKLISLMQKKGIFEKI